MAQPDDFRTNVQELQRTDAANQVCIECQSPNPQWASVSYGTFFCLDCSGTHRSLGVHLSFVRSITMDRWSQDQFRKMQMGGNAQFAAYAAAHADELGTKSLPAKYASRAAAIYRAQLTAACEGRPFDPATVQWSPPSAPPSAAATPAMGASPALGLGGGSGFGSASFGAGAPMAAPGSGFGSTGSMGGAPTREQNEDYFNRMGNANAGRSEYPILFLSS
ncbi:hypothetical protein BC828DRAFT_350197 [Blastocladiella britannica]|nr:hypothetical protein BC828DRAFT_350197 [Blastocladiella britannica]